MKNNLLIFTMLAATGVMVYAKTKEEVVKEMRGNSYAVFIGQENLFRQPLFFNIWHATVDKVVVPFIKEHAKKDRNILESLNSVKLINEDLNKKLKKICTIMGKKKDKRTGYDERDMLTFIPTLENITENLKDAQGNLEKTKFYFKSFKSKKEARSVLMELISILNETINKAIDDFGK